MNVISLFPAITLEEIHEDRWLDFDELDEHIFAWLYLYSNVVSLVYVPSAYVSYFESNSVRFYKDDANRTHMMRERSAMKLVSGHGHVIMLNEELYQKRFAIPTLQELLDYQAMIACPRKYEKPIHRFLRKAIEQHRRYSAHPITRL